MSNRERRVHFKWRPSPNGLTLHFNNRPRVLATVVPDEHHVGMYRILLPDGSVSDMVNLSRAKDAGLALGRKMPETASEAPPVRLNRGALA